MKLCVALLLVAATAFAEGTSSTVIWVPERVTYAQNTSWAGTDAMRCVSWTPPLSIAAATRMAWFINGGLGGGGLCSFTIYDATGATEIATTGAVDCSTTGTQEKTGITPFSLTAGTKYLMCTCANTNGGSYLGAEAGVTNSITTLENILAVPIGTSTANTCTAGVAPATTGVLSPVAVNMPVVLIATDMPATTTTTAVTTTTVSTTSATTTTATTTTATTSSGATTTTTSSTTATTTTSTTTTTTTTSTTTTTALPPLACSTLTQGKLVATQASYTTAGVSPGALTLRLAFIATRKDGAGAADPAPLVSGNGSTWDQVFTVVDFPTGYRVTAFRAMDVPITGALTFFYSANQRSAYWAVIECVGVRTTGLNGADAVTNENADGGTATAGLVTMGAFGSASNGVLGAWFPAVTNATPVVPGAGFTEIAEQGSTTEAADLEVEWKNSNDTSVDASWTQNVDYGGMGIEIVAGP